MPILAIEGPNRSGKTMLFDAMRSVVRARFVPNVPMLPGHSVAAETMEAKDLAMWTAMYDRERLYVCDRCVFVSGAVFAKIHGRRELCVPSCWREELLVAYLDVPEAELRRRGEATDEEPHDYGAEKAAYEAVLKNWKHIRLDGTLPMGELLQALEKCV